ncbi:MAG TPA: autotransporter-associated beta strand repeat-containing protein [Chthoniobacteraceae bacterium]|nr:autotransporter-associated beta strand repeat-containing protein [Chthoniobacteraceae bacterium]
MKAILRNPSFRGLKKPGAWSLLCALLIPPSAFSEITHEYQSDFPATGNVDWSQPANWSGGEQGGVPLTQQDAAEVSNTLKNRKLYLDLNDLHLGSFVYAVTSNEQLQIAAKGGNRTFATDRLVQNGSGNLQFLGGSVTDKLSVVVGDLEINGSGRMELGFSSSSTLESFTVTGTTTLNAGSLINASGKTVLLGAVDLKADTALSATGSGISGGLEVASLVGSGTVQGATGGTRYATGPVGTLTFNPTNTTPASFTGRLIDHSGSPSGSGELPSLRIIKTGTGTQGLSGNNSYTGSTEILEGTLLLNGSGHINTTSGIEINGGTLKSNSSVAVNAPIYFVGGTISGSGRINPGQTLLIGENHTLSPGDGVGAQTFGGDQSWQKNGNLNWQLHDAGGGAGTGYDGLTITGQLDLTTLSSLERFNLNLWSIADVALESSGDAIRFHSSGNYEFVIVTAEGGVVIADPLEVNQLFDIHLDAFNGTAGFTNPLEGGQWSVFINDNQLLLKYQAIPEPSQTVLTLVGLMAFTLLWRKSRCRSGGPNLEAVKK